MNYRIISIIAIFTFVVSCNTNKDLNSIKLNYMNDSLFVTAILDTTSQHSKIVNNQKTVFGEIIIENKQNNILKYSNRNLILVLNKLDSLRTYKNSIASEVVDFDFINIEKKEKYKMKVYWVFNKKNRISKVELIYN